MLQDHGGQVMNGLQESILRELPLAEAALHVFGHMLDDHVLQQIYEDHRGNCYERALTFPALAGLVLEALTRHGGSGHAAFGRAGREGRLPVAEANVYAKLGRVPLEVSKAVLREGSRRLPALLPRPSASAPAAAWPATLAALTAVVVDGKKIKNAAKRLQALRRLPGKMLAAKVLAGVSLQTGLVLAFEADADGERNDVPLVEGLLPQVRSQVEGPILWIADRQFADLNLPTKFRGERDHFLLRLTKKMSFTADPGRPEQCGVDTAGRRYREQWGWVGVSSDPRRRAVRLIELTAATDDGEDVRLMTDLVDPQAYPAVDLLAAYRLRWGIERVFQQVTEVFGLQTLIGCRPEGAVLQAALCFLLYNAIEVLRTHVAAAHDLPTATVSIELLFRDVVKQLTCWDLLIDRAATQSWLQRGWAAERLRDWLASRLTGRWHEGWRKAPAKKKPTAGWTPPKTPHGHGGHTAVFRALQAAKRS
jgi:hypothetical protein